MPGLISKRFSAPSAVDTGADASPAPRSESEVQRFLDAQQQMSDAINAHLGFRGYLMMMRLQRAANLRDLHDLLPDFAQALVKRLGGGHGDADRLCAAEPDRPGPLTALARGARSSTAPK